MHKAIILFTVLLGAATITSAMSQTPIEKDRELFKDEFKEPVLEKISDNWPHWPKGAKLYRVHDKKTLAELIKNHPRYKFSAYSEWVVVKDKKYPLNKFAQVLKQLKYQPSNEAAAIYTAARLAVFSEGLATSLIDKGFIETFEQNPELAKKLHPPIAMKENGHFLVKLFVYKQAQSGQPQEWIIRYSFLLGQNISKTTSRDIIWTVKNSYKW